MDKFDLIAVRGYVKEDRSFILATFLRGLYYGNSYFSMIPSQIFMRNYESAIDALLKLPGVQTRVACLREDPDVILGYAILGGGTVLNWVHVKEAWRKIGIAKQLVPPTVASVSHINRLGSKILRNHKAVVFNPFDIQGETKNGRESKK